MVVILMVVFEFTSKVDRVAYLCDGRERRKAQQDCLRGSVGYKLIKPDVEVVDFDVSDIPPGGFKRGLEVVD